MGVIPLKVEALAEWGLIFKCTEDSLYSSLKVAMVGIM